MSNNINYDWYKIFCCVAESGSITSAAERLFISQPAVSQSIKQLEVALECRLFSRSVKGVSLTAEGEVLFKQLSKGIEYIRLGEKNLKSQLNLESGELHIGASDMTLQYYLLPYLEKFHQLYPKIKISITNAPTPETIKFLEKDAIDFGVISEPIFDIESLISIPVKQIEDIFICGKNFLDLTENPLSPKELSELPLIMLEPNTSTRKYIDRYFADSDVTISPEFELATSSLIVQFVERNLGIGCVVKDFAENSILSKDVFELKLRKGINPRSIRIVKKDFATSKASEKLLELLNL